MNPENDHILEFLAGMGIEAEIILDGHHEKRVAIKTEQFIRHRDWVERWFTLVDQNEEYSYFYERLRGTGNTGKLG